MTVDPDQSELRTEATARVSICPVMTPRDPGASPVHCAGSRCMAWRPVLLESGYHGYCGLAGLPVTILVQVQAEIMRLAASQIYGVRPDA